MATSIRDQQRPLPPASPNGHHDFDFGTINSTPKKTALERPPPASQQSTENVANSVNGNGMVNRGVADFFSAEVFQIVLHNPSTAHQLLKFSQARMCGENMEFLERVCLFISSMSFGADDGVRCNR